MEMDCTLLQYRSYPRLGQAGHQGVEQSAVAVSDAKDERRALAAKGLGDDRLPRRGDAQRALDVLEREAVRRRGDGEACVAQLAAEDLVGDVRRTPDESSTCARAGTQDRGSARVRICSVESLPRQNRAPSSNGGAGGGWIRGHRGLTKKVNKSLWPPVARKNDAAAAVQLLPVIQLHACRASYSSSALDSLPPCTRGQSAPPSTGRSILHSACRWRELVRSCRHHARH